MESSRSRKNYNSQMSESQQSIASGNEFQEKQAQIVEIINRKDWQMLYQFLNA